MSQKDTPDARPEIPGRFPDDVYLLASGQGGEELLEPALGVAHVEHVADESGGENPRADDDGAMKSAELVCSADALRPILAAIVDRAAAGTAHITCEDAPKLACILDGGAGAPDVRLAFDGTWKAPGRLISIARLQPTAPDEASRLRGYRFVDDALDALAERRCSTGSGLARATR